jgi:hypothetical protein
MKKLLTKKYFSAVLIVLVALVFLVGNIGTASAQSQLQNNVTGAGLQTVSNTGGNQKTQPVNDSACSILGHDPCTAIVELVLNITSQFMAFIILMASWIITAGLALTTTVYSSQATQSGFTVTLAIANLGFVFAIIIIAIATILRSETYGYKKVLWRLVAMAILINFGLVITAPLVGFANGMTNYFMNSIQSGANGTTAIVTFTNKLAGSTNISALQGSSPQTVAGVSLGGMFFQTLFSLLFTIIFDGLIALTFLLLGVLLFVRYIYLVLLLIMLPLAWITWVFPSFSKHFSDWWKKFINWTFFPPAAMFFIWLAMKIQVNFANAITANNTPAAALAATTGLANTGTTAIGLLAQLTNSLVVIGVMIGGLLASVKLAENAGDFAVKQAKGVTNAVQGYVGRRTKETGRRLATAPLRTERMKNMATRLQQRTGIINLPARKIGQALEAGAVAGGSKAVGDAAGRFKDLTPDQRLNRLSGVELGNSDAQRMALLKQILDDKNLKKLSTSEMDRYFGKDQENTFKRFGQEKLYKDLQEKSGLALRNIDQEIDQLKISDPEKKLAKKEAEKYKMLAAYIEDDPEGAAGNFGDPKDLVDKRKKAEEATGRVPASLEEESVTRMQKNIIEAIANDKLSSSNVSVLIKASAKKNELETFKSAVQRSDNLTELQKNLSNPDNRILIWNDKQVGRGALDADLRKIYGLSPKQDKSNEQPRVVPSTDREEKEPRSRTIIS